MTRPGPKLGDKTEFGTGTVSAIGPMISLPSPATDAVMAHTHPSHEDGGPCAGCAFRAGTEANSTPHTVALARACVEGIRPFYCHENPGLCRGWVAAVNLNGMPENDEQRRWQEVNAHAADMLSDAIAAGRRADAKAEVEAGQ